MIASLLIALLLQRPDASAWAFALQSMTVTPGATITLAFNGFGANDMLQVRRGKYPANQQFPSTSVLLQSGPVKAQSKDRAVTVNQSGNLLTLTPVNDGNQKVVVVLVPDAPIQITQNGVARPFSGWLYMEGSYNSQDSAEINRRIAMKFPNQKMNTITNIAPASPPPGK